MPQVIVNNDGYNKDDVPHLQELHSKVKEWQPKSHEPSTLKEVKEAKNVYSVISRGKKIKGYFDKMQNKIGDDEGIIPLEITNNIQNKIKSLQPKDLPF